MTGFAVAFTATVHRVPVDQQKNRWGDPLAVPADHEVGGCAIYPGGSVEAVETRDTVSDTAVLLAPYGADIRVTDEVSVPDSLAVPPPYRGTRWRVDGTPEGWQSPFTGWRAGTAVTLTRQRG